MRIRDDFNDQQKKGPGGNQHLNKAEGVKYSYIHVLSN